MPIGNSFESELASPHSADNRSAVGGRLAAPAFPLIPTRVGQALPLHRTGPAYRRWQAL